MLTNHEPDRNIDDLTGTEICEAIRYLESDLTNAAAQDAENRDNDYGVMICILYVAVFGCLAFLWFYWR